MHLCRTALHVALEAGSAAIASLLLAIGADPDLEDEAGFDCFLLAEVMGLQPLIPEFKASRRALVAHSYDERRRREVRYVLRFIC